MRFIIWTAVWFGLDLASKFSPHYQETPENIKGLVAITMLALWIGLYVAFIKDESEV